MHTMSPRGCRVKFFRQSVSHRRGGQGGCVLWCRTTEHRTVVAARSRCLAYFVSRRHRWRPPRRASAAVWQPPCGRPRSRRDASDETSIAVERGRAVSPDSGDRPPAAASTATAQCGPPGSRTLARKGLGLASSPTTASSSSCHWATPAAAAPGLWPPWQQLLSTRRVLLMAAIQERIRSSAGDLFARQRNRAVRQ